MLAEPPLLVLDEPSVGLDPESRRDLWDLLRDYRRRGATVLLTTHSMEEAEALSDRVGIIHDGSLLALDTIANLRAAHGFDFKISYLADGRTRVLYGANDTELLQQVQSLGIREYAVSRTTLEDVYLGLTDGKGRLKKGPTADDLNTNDTGPNLPVSPLRDRRLSQIHRRYRQRLRAQLPARAQALVRNRPSRRRLPSPLVLCYQGHRPRRPASAPPPPCRHPGLRRRLLHRHHCRSGLRRPALLRHASPAHHHASLQRCLSPRLTRPRLNLRRADRTHPARIRTGGRG